MSVDRTSFTGVDAEDPPGGAMTLGQKKRRTVREFVTKVFNPATAPESTIKSACILTAEFFGVLVIAYFTITARGGFMSSSTVAGSIAATYASVYFVAGYFFTPIDINPVITGMNMIFFTETPLRGFARMIVQFVGWLIGALLAHVQIGYDRFENVAVIPDGDFNTWQAFMIEWIGETVGAFMIVGFAASSVGLPVASLILGLFVLYTQSIAYPISSASFNIFHWLATGAVGTFRNGAHYWPDNCYIYALAPIGAFVTAAVMVYVWRKMIIATDPAQYEKIANE